MHETAALNSEVALLPEFMHWDERRKVVIESWLGESAQRDKWRFCLTAARMAA